MWKLRIGGAAAACLIALAAAAPSPAAQGGDANAGDVWTDNVGSPAGPGHEQDTHLACQDINLWGAGLADSSGAFTIDGWPPSGQKEQDYSGTWSYDPSQGGDQVLAVISVSQLIANAQANGDAPKNKQGYHFKLQLTQDPQKSKTFWVNCSPSGSQTSSTTSAAGTTQSNRSASGSGLSGSTSSGATSTGTAPSTSASSSPSSAVKGVRARRHRHKHHRHKHHRKHRRLSHRAITFAGFTG